MAAVPFPAWPRITMYALVLASAVPTAMKAEGTCSLRAENASSASCTAPAPLTLTMPWGFSNVSGGGEPEINSDHTRSVEFDLVADATGYETSRGHEAAGTGGRTNADYDHSSEVIRVAPKAPEARGSRRLQKAPEAKGPKRPQKLKPAPAPAPPEYSKGQGIYRMKMADARSGHGQMQRGAAPRWGPQRHSPAHQRCARFHHADQMAGLIFIKCQHTHAYQTYPVPLFLNRQPDRTLRSTRESYGGRLGASRPRLLTDDPGARILAAVCPAPASHALASTISATNARYLL
jgi:hypothetical protein